MLKVLGTLFYEYKAEVNFKIKLNKRYIKPDVQVWLKAEFQNGQA